MIRWLFCAGLDAVKDMDNELHFQMRDLRLAGGVNRDTYPALLFRVA